MMTNPISFVKNTRTLYSLQYRKKVTEVLVQFANEDPAWIPMDTLDAMVQTLLNATQEIVND
jgi:hypothetical protein